MAATGRPVCIPERDLHAEPAALLADGDVHGVYAHHCDAAMAIALAAVCAGWSRARFEAAMAEERNAGGAWWRRATTYERGRLWYSAVLRYLDRPPASDNPSVAAEIAAIHHRMQEFPGLWGGQAGPTDYHVLRALLEIAAQAGQLTPSASTRQIAERTPVVHQTVSVSLRRLEDAGWVRVVAPARGPEAPQFRLLYPEKLPEHARRDDTADEDDPALGTPRWASEAGHDTWVHCGLGRVAARVYEELDDARPAGVDRLVARTGLHRRTVRRHLRRLADVGLAVETADGWRRGPASLDDVAGELGSAGTLAARAALHAQQRAWYQAYFVPWWADRARRRGWAVERGLYTPAGPRVAAPPAGGYPSRRWPGAATPALDDVA